MIGYTKKALKLFLILFFLSFKTSSKCVFHSVQCGAHTVHCAGGGALGWASWSRSQGRAPVTDWQELKTAGLEVWRGTAEMGFYKVLPQPSAVSGTVKALF